MVDRIWRRDLDQRLAEYIQGRKLSDPGTWPSNAQLSRLRAIALNALPSGDLARVDGFLGALRARAREQYERARVEDRRLLTWLQDRLQNPEAIWEVLDPETSQTVRPAIGEVTAQRNERMANEYTLRLVEGILHRAAKERRAKERDDD
jgi:hypothetical protein